MVLPNCARFNTAGTKIFLAFDAATLRWKQRSAFMKVNLLEMIHVSFHFGLLFLLQEKRMHCILPIPIDTNSDDIPDSFNEADKAPKISQVSTV